MIKLSAGTAHVLGMERLKTDAPPTTAYLMAGEGCNNNCYFCAQAAGSQANKNDLSRIRWQQFEMKEIITNLGEAAKQNDLKRTCIQAVDNEAIESFLPEVLQLMKEEVDLPVCVSKNVSSLEEIEKLVNFGVDRVNIALDVVNPTAYGRIKGGSYEQKYDFLREAAQKFPGRISTHIIIGLGESEQEVIKLLVELKRLQITVGIFAFTPLPGTELAGRDKPSISKYRRIQIAKYLIYNHDFVLKDFEFNQQRLINIKRTDEDFKKLLEDGKAFETTGCPGCNRPYYNEKPGGVIYNYPRPLSTKEVVIAIKESGLVKEDE